MSGLHRKLQQKATKVKVKLENPTITLRHSSVIIQNSKWCLKWIMCFHFRLSKLRMWKGHSIGFWSVRMLAFLQFTSGEKIRSLNIPSLIFWQLWSDYSSPYHASGRGHPPRGQHLQEGCQAAAAAWEADIRDMFLQLKTMQNITNAFVEDANEKAENEKYWTDWWKCKRWISIKL